MAIYKLEDVINIVGGKDVSFSSSGNVAIVGSGGIIGWSNLENYHKNTFTIPRVGTMKIHWYDIPFWNINTAFLVKNKDSNNFNTKYLYYKFLSEEEWKANISSTTRPLIKKSDLFKLKLDIPDINEQQKIIDIIEQNEILFMKYSSVIDISNFVQCKKTFKKIIDIIEPLELEEGRLNKLIELIDSKLKLLFFELDNLKISTPLQLSDFVEISKNKEESLNIKAVGVGYGGFKPKRGKIAKTSKTVRKNEFVVGLISKGIPIAFNYNEEVLGVSTAYYVFKSKKETLANSWYVYQYILHYWKRFIKASARQGQGFDVEMLLSEWVDSSLSDKLKKYNDDLVTILDLKFELTSQVKKILATKEKAISYLIN